MNKLYSGEIALTVGTFDGVHIGHQSLLKKTAEIAGKRGIKSAAYTYLVPPKRYFTGGEPPLIIPPKKKITVLNEYVDEVIVGNFDNVKNLSPGDFVENILIHDLRVDAVIVGTDWRFGNDRTGTISDLSELAKNRFTIHPQNQVMKFGRPVSSTWIRDLLRKGKIDQAGELLGRYPSLSGKVVKGDSIGRQVGYPTANLDVDNRVVLPPPGSYAAIVHLGNKKFGGAAYVGTRPTFDKVKPQVEVHVINFDGEIYSEEIEIDLVKFISPSKRYASKEELQGAIEDIITEIEKVLEAENLKAI